MVRVKWQTLISAMSEQVGSVSLYKQKECVQKNIPAEEAVERLMELIKANI